MQADRWSSPAWFVALAVDIALCVYLAISVCWHPPRPSPGWSANPGRPLPGEVECGHAHRTRLIAEVDRVERELARTEVGQVYVADQLRRIHSAYLGCVERPVSAKSAIPDEIPDRVAVP